jgi:ubiquinone/menaquinone biosynthesis C-methylase UbiE
MQKSQKQIVNYYHTVESKLGYKIILGGTKHFGYYPRNKEHISMALAMQNMTDKLGKTLKLSPGSIVLDAGSGEGTTAIRIANQFNLRVEGVELLDFNVRKANKRLAQANLLDKVHFTKRNYMHLHYPDNYFDGVYTIETLVHASDYKKALKEFNRVLKPKGKLVLFEYTLPRNEDMDKREKWAFETIIEGSAMHSYPYFTHGSFTGILTDAGFVDVRIEEITKRILPMLHKFSQIALLPYQIIKLFGRQKKYVNTTSGVELYRYRNDFRYNVISAEKK